MASYEIQWKNSAKKELKQITRDQIPRIIKAVEELAEDPFPAGSRKMTQMEATYRIRVGEDRVIYSVDNEILVIDIIRVGSRGDVYKHLL